jgi:two-component system, NtrC family, sensor kinase
VGGVLSATILVAGVVGVRQYRSIMGPVRALDRAVTRIAGIELDHRVPEQGDREFRRLIGEFNRMSATIQRLHESMSRQVEIKSRQLVRSERLASVGTLAAGLAHEINNPLGIIAGYAQTTLRRLDRAADDESRREALARAGQTLRVICEEAFRCRDIAGRLLEMARPGEEEPKPVVLAAVAREAIELVQHLPVASGRGLECRIEERDARVACLGQSAELLQVLINLLTNALEATEPGSGRVVISMADAEDRAIVEVLDNGCGMDEETVARAFDPFFTDKPRRGLSGVGGTAGGGGSGLGLSISHAIVERHGGRLFAQSDGPGRGSTFTVELPAMGAREAGERHAAESSHA